MSTALRILCLPACVMSAACASYAAVRSAEVLPGPTVSFQGSTALSADNGGAFARGDCGGCSFAGDVGVTLGAVPTKGPAFAIAGGLNGIYPYLDGYLQVKRGGPHTYGVGARLGVAIEKWYHIYGRYDLMLTPQSRLLLNPGVFRHSDQSFMAFVQGVGVQFDGRRTSVVPAVSLVLGSGGRRPDGRRIETGAAPLTASLAVFIHLPRGR